MLSFYLKYHIQANLALLTLLGLACGLLAGTIIDAAIPLQTSQEIVSSGTVRAETQKVTPADLNLILQRNIFDPTSRSATATMQLRGRTKATNGSTPPLSARGKRVLLGTVVATDRSLALLKTADGMESYRLNEELPDGGTVEEIERNRITIRETDRSLTVVEVSENSFAPQTNRQKPAAAAEVRKIGERHWVVAKETAARTRQNLSQELQLAQMQPYKTAGQTTGFIIRSLKRNSILKKLGMKPGDVIFSVNNVPLESPEKALQVFQQLREARQISIAVERNKEKMNFTYELN